jgi:hypothetical protein
MSGYQVRWSQLMKDVKSRHLSRNNMGSLYSALSDADAIIEAALHYRRACSEGEKASVAEECGDAPERSSESWFEEAKAAESALFDALERLELANDQGYSGRATAGAQPT